MQAQFNGRNALITGGLGFIGSHLAQRLVSLGAKVTLVDSMIPEYGGNYFNVSSIRDQVAINISDVRDEFGFKTLIKNQDFLFNLAGQTSHMDSMSDPLTDLEINARAQLHILEACRKHNPNVKIVFASTRQIYGKPDYLPVDEMHPLRPVDINGINKLAGESFHLLYNNVHGIKSCALRLTNTIGPHMRVKDARQTFLGVWIRALVERKDFEIWGGAQRRDFNFVSDVVDALLLAALSEKTNGEIFNLGSEEVISLAELGKLLVEINGGGNYKIADYPSDRKKIDIGDYYTSFKKARQALGWSPKVPLKEGLKATLSFYHENLSHYL